MVPVSIIVPIKNEASNLERCLASVAWADEIFVVDSQSTDGSQKIAEGCGARVVQFEFNGTWPKKKKLGAGEHSVPARVGLHPRCG
jgi:glycosyltransferase involved in cell wall biosynthesis